MAKKIKKNGTEGLREVRGAGYTATKKVKRDKSVNRRAGLHDKRKNLDGEVRVKRRKPLALKHVRRLRKFAAVASIGVVGAVGVFGVGFFKPAKDITLEGDYATVCYETPKDNSKPTEHTLVEAVGYMNYTLQNQKYWSSNAVTTVIAAGFEQEVRNYKQYYDDVLISSDISLGFVNYGEQFCQTRGVVLSRMAATSNPNELKKGMNTSWSTGPATGMTVKAFKQNRGLPPYDFSVYVLNENTIANANDTTITDNGDGTYSMTLELNVNTGVDETCAEYYYKLQQKVNGTLYDVPTFYTASISYVFDENWRVLSFEINDTSKTPKASNLIVNSSSSTKTEFYYDEASAYNTFWEDYYKAEYERLKDTLRDDDVLQAGADNALNYLSSAFGSVLTDGAIFKVDLSIGELDLNGVVAIDMITDAESGASNLGGLSAKLGDILVWLDGETLYVNDGASKYKLNVNGLLSSGEDGGEGGDLLGGFDVAALMNQMTEGEFTLNEETGVAKLVSEVELFGLKIPMEFEFQKAEDGGVTLNFLKAEIPVGGKVVKAKLCFGAESDEPAIPEDTSKYQDVLNDGITLAVSLNANGFTLDGIAKIIMQNGAFAGVIANFDDITVYYDCPRNMLYLSVGNVKYKLDISALNTGGTDLSALLGSFDAGSLLSDVLANLTTGETTLGTSLGINIDALGSALSAALNIRLYGGLKIDADLALDGLGVSLSVALSNSEVALPDVSAGYKDILNSEITFDVGLTLMTGLADESGNRDEVTLEGQVALCIADGVVTELRAVFGELAVYFDFSANELYIKAGTTKVMLNLNEMDLSDTGILSGFAGGDFASVDLHAAIKELLTNLVGDGKIISTGTEIVSVPVWAELDLSEGVSVRLGLNVLGVDATANVGISGTALGGLSDEEKEEYLDVLKDTWSCVDKLFGDRISATVKGGKLYSYDEKYADSDYVKYAFDASLKYDKGAVSVNEAGVEVDSKAYIRLGIDLTATHSCDGSLYLDIVLMDANPVTGSDGKTTGGYTQDGKFDVYLSVSNRLNNPVPLQLYAPVDEILTLASMVGAMANLDRIEIEAVKQISSLLDGMLISKYLPKGVQDKFASLGDSLIPQILGVSLEELLNNLFGNVEDTVEKSSSDFSLSDKYVSSIKATDESLILVLDSSLIYNSGTGAKDDLTVEFTRVCKDGVYYVGGVNLTNVYFGENEVNKLDLGLTLGYDEIIRPDASSAFAGYLNADGLDTLVNGVINSATHKVEGTEAGYDLNHYYLLQGSVTAKINIVGLKLKEANIQIKSLAVYIDEETNNVTLDAHIYYDAVGMVGQVVIDGKADVYLSMQLGSNQGGGNIIIRKVRYSRFEGWSEKTLSTPSVEVRSMTLKEFSDNMLDNVIFILSLGSTVTERLDGAENGGGNGVNFDGFDYGQYLNAILAYYVSERTATGASWTIAINKGLLTDLIGMTTSDIPVKFSADLNDDGSYTVKSLEIIKSNMQLVSSIVDLDFWGSFTYCNPNEQMGEGYVDSSADLFNTDVQINSEYDLKYTEDSFKWACGSYVRLPVGVPVTSDGASHILIGYTAATPFGTESVQFEGYVEEDGVRYGLVTLKSDTVYTAIWDTAYTVSFTDENGKELYSVVYRENDVLDFGNMPACPEVDGYTSQWVGENGSPANGTSVTGNMSFRVEYTKAPLKVKLNSTLDFNYAGYDGTYKSLNLGFEEGASYTLSETTAEGYTFLGWWYQDNGGWRSVTSVEEFVDAGSVTLEALWLKIDTLTASSKRTDHRDGFPFFTLYYDFYIESEVSYHFEGTESLRENITCIKTVYRAFFNMGGGFNETQSHITKEFDGYQNKLEQQMIELKDSNGSAKFTHWNIVVTLSFEMPDGTTWTTPQKDMYLSGKY